MALDRTSMRWKLFVFKDNRWELIFRGYSEEFTKSHISHVRWADWTWDVCIGVGISGILYKIIEEPIG